MRFLGNIDDLKTLSSQRDSPMAWPDIRSSRWDFGRKVEYETFVASVPFVPSKKFGQRWPRLGNYGVWSLVHVVSVEFSVSRSSAFRWNSLGKHQYHLPWNVSLADLHSNTS